MARRLTKEELGWLTTIKVYSIYPEVPQRAVAEILKLREKNKGLKQRLEWVECE